MGLKVQAAAFALSPTRLRTRPIHSCAAMSESRKPREVEWGMRGRQTSPVVWKSTGNAITGKPALRKMPMERGMWLADVTSSQRSPGFGCTSAFVNSAFSIVLRERSS